MNAARYYIAVFAVVMYPPAVAGWFLLHPLARTWRRLGPVVTYMIILPVLFGMIGALYAARAPLLATEFGTNWFLIPPGLVLLVSGIGLDVLRARKLGTRTVLGIPELRGESTPESLVRTGIYARVRHPRYVSVMIGVAGIALLTNYLATYILVPVVGVGLYLVTVLEEQELVARFGDSYRDYQRRVPRFVPRRGATD